MALDSRDFVYHELPSQQEQRQQRAIVASIHTAFVEDGCVDFRGRSILRASSGGWKACSFIIGYELVERLAYYGISSSLVIYLTTQLHEGTASSAKNVNNWTGVTTVLPIIGAFIADAYWGRYRTIATLSLAYILGLILLAISVSLTVLKPPACQTGNLVCPKATSLQLGIFFVALYLIAIATGGIKPCLEAFGADQFDENDPDERKNKSSFFNWWYFGLCTGALLAFTVIVYIQENVSWGVGYGILAVIMVVAVGMFFVGTPFYRIKLPGGSPLSRIAQVLVASIRKWDVKVPSDHNLLYEVYDKESLRIGRRQLQHTKEFMFLDKAATEDMKTGELALREQENENPKEEQEALMNPWKICTVTQVEEVKLVFRIIPVWLTTITYGVVIAQASTLFTKQGQTMDRRIGPHFEIPAASLLTFSSIVILILLPLYEYCFLPAARFITGYECGITLLQRLGIGILLSILCIVAAALTEMKRLKVAEDSALLDDPTSTVPLSIFWILPQYLLLGASDVFALVGQQEFFYDQVPDTMRSLGMALYLCSTGLGSFLSSFLITLVDTFTSQGGNSWFVDNINRCHIDYFYWLLAGLSILNLGFYLLVAHHYTYKKIGSSMLFASRV